jgi:hypothetical protein
MSKYKEIIIHTSDSIHGSATAIRAWHRMRGWIDIGYHFVILNGLLEKNLLIKSMNGMIEYGRPINITPASVKGHNVGTIAIVLIGKHGKYTKEQFESLFSLVRELMKKYDIGIKSVKGHYELDPHKTCPNIDMDKFRTALEVLENGD